MWKQVDKEVFFHELTLANQQDLDPMPERHSDLWTCTKTKKVFGKVIKNKRYYLLRK